MTGVGRSSLTEARETLLGLCKLVPPLSLPLDRAVGRVLASPLVSAKEHPATTIALIDGWAMASADTVGASAYTPAIIGTLHPVHAGAPLPEGTNAVLPMDGLVREFGEAAVQASLAPGENARRPGHDVPAGVPLLEAGRRITPIAAGIASLAGIKTADVRMPRILLHHLSGPGSRMAAGTLGIWLNGLGADCHAMAFDHGIDILGERPGDLAIVIGDASVALDDRLVDMVAKRGHVVAHGLSMRPGDTIACGSVSGRPVLVIPYRPEALLAALLLLIAPLLDALEGVVRVEKAAPVVRPLARKIVSTVGLSELALLTLTDDGRAFAPLCVGDIDWRSCAAARYYAELSPGTEGSAEGDMFEAIPIRSRWTSWNAETVK